MRKSKSSRRILIILLLFLVCVGFVVRYVPRSYDKSAGNSGISDDKLEVHVLDVDQSESILVVQGEHAMLIDSGKFDSGQQIVDYLKDVGIYKLDYLVLTHFHRDHVGGVHRVISECDVKNVICMDARYVSSIQEAVWYTDFKLAELTADILHKGKITRISPYESNGKLISFELGDAQIQILSQDPSKGNVNNKSIVMKLNFGGISQLFMGDAEKEIEADLLEAEINVKADVLKIGHHGSKTSTSFEFLKTVNPLYAVISCGKENNYGHPNSFVMEKLEKLGITVHRTDIEGTIKIVVDKNGIIEFNSEKD